MIPEVKKRRIQKGLKQCDLAKTAKISISNLSRNENNWAVPRYDTAIKLARVLECSVQDIFPELEIWEDYK
jgi:DNA-binding XRE family transcriptional regulator